MMNVSNQNSEEMQRDLENLAGDDELVANPRDLPAVRVVSDVHMPNCLKGSASKPAVVVDDGKIHDDYLQGRVTPELLKHFKEDEALELVKYFYQTPSTPTQCVGNDYCLENLSRENLGFLKGELNGRNVIELGNAGWNRNPNMTPFELESYVGVDADYEEDALTYLMKQPDESAVICSFGVLESGVLDSWFGRDRPLGKYIDILAKEVCRVTPAGAITLHGTDGFDELEKAGFRDKKVLHKGHGGDVVTYRK